MLTEPLEVKDLEFKRAKKFDAVKQYARGKRHQVALAEHWAGVESANAGGTSSRAERDTSGTTRCIRGGWIRPASPRRF